MVAPENGRYGNTGTVLDLWEPRDYEKKILGFEFLSVDRQNQSLQAKFYASELLLNYSGSIHGGFLTAMLDEIMSKAIFVISEGALTSASMALNIQFVRPAPAATLLGEARIIHQTRRTIFTEARLTDADDKLLVKGAQTHRVFRASQESE